MIDFDGRSDFDMVRHHIVLEKVARRMKGDAVMWLVKLLWKASGKPGVPPGGVSSPLFRISVPPRGGPDAGTGESSHPARRLDGSRVGPVCR